jgi:hypothetical protein
MKLDANKVFGGISVLVGIAVLYYAKKQADAGPAQVNVLPQLQPLQASYAPGQPTANGASIPAFYASPFQLTPDLIQKSTGQPQQVPYQVYNMPPTHVESKQTAPQIMQTAAQQPAQQSGACCDSCAASHSSCEHYAQRTTVTQAAVRAQANNMSGVGLRPIGKGLQPLPSIYSPATAFHLATQTTVPAALNMANQGVTMIGNVPNVSDLIQ